MTRRRDAPREVAPLLRDNLQRAWKWVAMSTMLAIGLRWRPMRLLLARMRWPRPEHVDRMSPAQIEAFLRSTGVVAEAQKALLEYRGGGHQSEAVTSVRSAEGRDHGRPRTAVH
jgi:hypothetical protein